MSSGIPLGFLSFIERGQPASTVSIGGRLYPWRSSDRTKNGYRLAGQAKAQKLGKAIVFHLRMENLYLNEGSETVADLRGEHMLSSPHSKRYFCVLEPLRIRKYLLRYILFKIS